MAPAVLRTAIKETNFGPQTDELLKLRFVVSSRKGKGTYIQFALADLVLWIYFNSGVSNSNFFVQVVDLLSFLVWEYPRFDTRVSCGRKKKGIS